METKKIKKRTPGFGEELHKSLRKKNAIIHILEFMFVAAGYIILKNV